MRTIHRDIVGPFIFSSDNQLLLGKSRKGGVYKDQWIIPGGGVETGETKIEALIREIIEEVGIDISTFDITLIDDTLTGQSEKILRDTGKKVIVNMAFYNFLVRPHLPASEIPIKCDDDFIEASWFPLAELSKLELAPPTEVALQKLGYL